LKQYTNNIGTVVVVL